MNKQKKIIIIGQSNNPENVRMPKGMSQNDVAKTIIANWGDFGDDEIAVLQPLANILDVFKSSSNREDKKQDNPILQLIDPAAAISFINSAKRSIQFEKKQGHKITPELVKNILVVKKNGIEYTMVEAQEKKLESIKKDEEHKMNLVATLIEQICSANGLEFEGKLSTK